MTLVGGEHDRTALVEHGHHQHDVILMCRPAHVRIVQDDDVALIESVQPELVDHLLHRIGQDPDERWNPVCLGDHACFGISDRAAVVEDLVDDRALARAPERGEHLFRGRDQGAFDHFHRERIDTLGAHSPTSVMMRLPNLSTWTCCSG